MPMIPWDPELETGIVEIDFQHKELFNIVNQFLGACEQDKCREEIDKLLTFFELYCVNHFSMEEKLQEQFTYPDYPTHKEAHEQFIQNFSEIKKTYQEEGASFFVCLRAYETIVDWFIQHISLVDKKFCAFLKTKS